MRKKKLAEAKKTSILQKEIKHEEVGSRGERKISEKAPKGR